MVFAPNHRGWGSNQPPEQWTNVTVSIFPYIARGFQITASSSNLNTLPSAYIPLSNVTLFDGTFQFLRFSIFYWDNVFPIYLGLYHPFLTNFTKFSSYSPFCDVSHLVLGRSPQ
jgi:hypothetical protein